MTRFEKNQGRSHKRLLSAAYGYNLWGSPPRSRTLARVDRGGSTELRD